MSFRVQQTLFSHALTHIAAIDLANRVVEIALTADKSVRMELYPRTRT